MNNLSQSQFNSDQVQLWLKKVKLTNKKTLEKIENKWKKRPRNFNTLLIRFDDWLLSRDFKQENKMNNDWDSVGRKTNKIKNNKCLEKWANHHSLINRQIFSRTNFNFSLIRFRYQLTSRSALSIGSKRRTRLTLAASSLDVATSVVPIFFST